MKTLVTGGGGFTGSHLVRRLLEEGHAVRSLDTDEGMFFQELREGGADMRVGSITDKEAVSQAVTGCEVVFHLAAAFRKLNVPDRHYWDVNVEGTRNVAEASLRSGVRKLVYCSTQGVHGHIKEVPGDEQSPIAPEDYYQLTKYEGEVVVRDFVAQGLDAVIIRPTAIYGPGDPGRFLMLFRMVKRSRFWMFGDGKTYYHPVHVDNLVDGFLLAANGEVGRGEAFLIGDEQYWPLNELVRYVAQAMDTQVRIRHLPFWPLYGAAWACEAICKPLGITPPVFRRRANWFRQDRAFSIDKARNQLGYAPRVGILEGLQQTAKWYVERSYV